MKKEKFNSFSWSGADNKFLDQPHLSKCNNMFVGCYGGNTKAGQYKNEDGAFVTSGTEWEFSLILDAHNSANCTELLLKIFNSVKDKIFNIFIKDNSLFNLNKFILKMFNENKKKLSSVKGETACLICARKENYLYWFSIGDCLVYLLNDELEKMGQYALNQRQFYEWVGEINTFDLKVPCYSSGTRELRKGNNIIILVTDGLLEYPKSPFLDNAFLYTFFTRNNLEKNILEALKKVHEGKGRDSATIIGFSYKNNKEGAFPTG